MGKTCSHIKEIHDVTPKTTGCEECLKTGDAWMHLRICMECGHIGCCDDSKNKHATKHFHETGHPIIFSFEHGETWGYCYEDDFAFETNVSMRDRYEPYPTKEAS